ncbi:MAG: phospho-N-acetylmuramoyl-pentapeptide-transferase [Candidatus Neomarinimicrobiota bacterium]|nr:MAG: phospho-N-acetylmuramoyl-pentapeptide-transferase [Candidatus Neomarinimicrobiota bacterium]
MLYHFLYPLREYISGFNLFQYITFRAAMAALLALVLSFFIGPPIIRWMKKYQIGENIRDVGPESHRQKQGTPTMGGVLILGSVLLPTLLFARLDNVFIQIILFVTVWTGLIGFLDDYLKNIRHSKKGLIARYKLVGQIILGIVITVWIQRSHIYGVWWSQTSVPFFKDTMLNLGWLYPVLILVVLTGTSNAVNLTDGLDGLASGLLTISFGVFGVVAYITGRVDFSDYLNIIYLPGAGELTIFASAMAGACLGFLWYNAPPAQIFMGDVGSLSAGAALGSLAILLKKELLLLIIGGVFAWETISVILQLGYFRWTKSRTGEGKRLFKMAPVHHHYELLGWSESKIVIRFWILGILLAIFSISTFKIR